MISIKTPEEIKIIAEAGKILARVKQVVVSHIKPGITLVDLDSIAEQEIVRLGAEPAFKRIPGYRWATCINLNDGLVHGIPTRRKIVPGDRVSVDVGIYYQGWNVDSAFTMGVEPVSPELSRFINVGKEALAWAIREAQAGNRVGNISSGIERAIRKAGYSPSFTFTGHGIGRKLQEEPAIPCFLNGRISQTPLLTEGMVLAVEVIYTQGMGDIIVEEDGWTVRTRDGKMGGLFEETVAVTKSGPRALTANVHC